MIIIGKIKKNKMKKQNNVITGIYKITNPKGKVYIGQSMNIEERKKYYRRLSQTKSQPKIHNSLQKYGWEQHVFEIIEECSVEQLDERETQWKKYYLELAENKWNEVLFCDLYDLGGGPKSEVHRRKIGEGNKGKTLSDEAKKKIGEFHKGIKRTLETKNKISQAKKGVGHSIQHNNNKKGKRGSQPNMKKPKPDGFGEKVSNRLLGKKQSEETRRKKSESMKGKILHYKEIIQYSLEGNFIKEWNSITEAKKWLGKGDIQGCVLGKTKTAGGYIWKHKNKENEN